MSNLKSEYLVCDANEQSYYTYGKTAYSTNLSYCDVSNSTANTIFDYKNFLNILNNLFTNLKLEKQYELLKDFIASESFYNYLFLGLLSILTLYSFILSLKNIYNIKNRKGAVLICPGWFYIVISAALTIFYIFLFGFNFMNFFVCDIFGYPIKLCHILLINLYISFFTLYSIIFRSFKKCAKLRKILIFFKIITVWTAFFIIPFSLILSVGITKVILLINIYYLIASLVIKTATNKSTTN